MKCLHLEGNPLIHKISIIFSHELLKQTILCFEQKITVGSLEIGKMIIFNISRTGPLKANPRRVLGFVLKLRYFLLLAKKKMELNNLQLTMLKVIIWTLSNQSISRLGVRRVKNVSLNRESLWLISPSTFTVCHHRIKIQEMSLLSNHVDISHVASQSAPWILHTKLQKVINYRDLM